MNVQKFAKLFGAVMLLVGILGFVPGLAPGGMLLGLFEVNALHNIVHIVTGIAGLWAAGTAANARLFFKVFGIVYGLVTVLGIVMNGNILGLIMINMADTLLHVVITIVALYAGFGTKDKMM